MRIKNVERLIEDHYASIELTPEQLEAVRSGLQKALARRRQSAELRSRRSPGASIASTTSVTSCSSCTTPMPCRSTCSSRSRSASPAKYARNARGQLEGSLSGVRDDREEPEPGPGTGPGLPGRLQAAEPEGAPALQSGLLQEDLRLRRWPDKRTTSPSHSAPLLDSRLPSRAAPREAQTDAPSHLQQPGWPGAGG